MAVSNSMYLITVTPGEVYDIIKDLKIKTTLDFFSRF